MQLRLEQKYVTRGGKVIGPLLPGEQFSDRNPIWPFKFGDNHFMFNGKSCHSGDGSAHRAEDDIVAEYDPPTSNLFSTAPRMIQL